MQAPQSVAMDRTGQRQTWLDRRAGWPPLLLALAWVCSFVAAADGQDEFLSHSAELTSPAGQTLDAVPFEAAIDNELADASGWPASADWAWRKGEYTIVPYGIGWLNMALDTERTNNGAFTFFVLSRDVEGQPGFTINARATRLGFDFTGPPVLYADYRGKVEIDFFGSAQTENRAGVLLRHAYGEFRNERWRLLGGQTSDVVSPLNPSMLNYSVGWAAGNIGYRRAQVRVERYLYPGEQTLLTLQAALARSIVTDFAAETALEGHDAGWPTVQARGAITVGERGPGADPLELGISGHIGQEAIDFESPPVDLDVPYTSWSLNVDANFPLGDRWGLRGEFFWGDVLGTFLGGINQEVDRFTRQGVRSVGGWGEIWFHATEAWAFHAGYGIDDPLNQNLSAGGRLRNQVLFANAVYSVSDLFDVGLEVSWWETSYRDLAPGEALRVETVFRYRF